MNQSITVDGKTFELVAVQRDGKSAIYKGKSGYLRIGAGEKIARDLMFHRRMEDAGFPVAAILAEGELDGLRYFIEASFGAKHLGTIFAEDVVRTGSIEDRHFEQFLSIGERFAKAQLATKTGEQDFEKFADGIHLPTLCGELPQYASRIQKRFKEASYRLAALPFVVTHGDFNPNNIYSGGVIDLEDSFWGPAGYDLVTALVHIDYFPGSQEYEYFAGYHFTSRQKQKYLEVFDGIFVKNGLQPLSTFKDDFEFCRAVWHAVRMHAWPKVQKFRYDLLVRKFLAGP